MTQHKGEFHLIKYNIDMKQIDIKQINDNVFETIGKEWILVAAGNKDKFNMMTASWGCLGWLWNKPVAVVFIRPGFEQARLTLECRKLYKDSMSAEKFIDKDLLQWYGAKGGFHDVYVVEITHAYAE